MRKTKRKSLKRKKRRKARDIATLQLKKCRSDSNNPFRLVYGERSAIRKKEKGIPSTLAKKKSNQLSSNTHILSLEKGRK